MKKEARRHTGTKALSEKRPDRFDLYEAAVTAPGPMAKFLRAVHGGSPRVLGEDFSGTAALARAWVELDTRHAAVAVDKDRTVVARISEACAESFPHSRFRAIASNVLRVKSKCDIIAATNFPICYWHTRRDLVRYLKHVRSRLNPRGVFVADLYGGSDSFTTGTTKVRVPTRWGAMEYSFEQRAADARTGRVLNALHFRIGKRTIRDAFVYDWRLWSIPELADAMMEAGFRGVEIYDSLGDAEDQDGNVYVRPAEELSDPFVVYVAAKR